MPRGIEPLQLKSFKDAKVDLDEEMVEAFLSLTALQQDIALNHLLGMNNLEAYNNSRGKAKTDEAKISGASEILVNPDAHHFIQLAKKNRLENTIMTREEALDILSNSARANTSELVVFDTIETEDSEGNKKKQSVWSLTDSAQQDPKKLAWITELQAGPQGLKFKIHDHKQAIKQLSEMEGWNAAQKMDHLSSDGSMTPKGFNDFYGDDEQTES